MTRSSKNDGRFRPGHDPRRAPGFRRGHDPRRHPLTAEERQRGGKTSARRQLLKWALEQLHHTQGLFYDDDDLAAVLAARKSNFTSKE